MKKLSIIGLFLCLFWTVDIIGQEAEKKEEKKGK